MTVFGDDDPADAVTVGAPVDVDQVARRLHEERARLEALRGRAVPRWEALDDDERAVAIAIVVAVVAWLRREGHQL